MSAQYVWKDWEFDGALFVAIVADALHDLGLSVDEIAVLAGIHPSTVSRIVRGEYQVGKMGVHHIVALCNVLDLDPCECFLLADPDQR